jgi:transcriptional regulator with XRE-family HTH domain
MTGDPHFARVTSARRQALGLDQRTVAENVGVTQQTISRWESGISLPRREAVHALARALDLDVDELHRLAGYASSMAVDEVVDLVHAVHSHVHRFSDEQLLLLLDLLWRTHYERGAARLAQPEPTGLPAPS